MRPSSQQQGAAFEKLLHELLTRLFTVDLGHQVLQNSLQSSGVQYGKDIQTKWRGANGEECFWHFECKSHQEGVLHQKEVADKIIDVYRSGHRINVWCLALAHVEPGAWIDEVFAWANDRLNLPFFVAVLSPQRNFIKDLFACHADLHRQLYPGQPMPVLSGEDRRQRLASFASFLQDSTQRGRQLALQPHGEWELVSPSRLRELPNLPEQRSAYLRGLTPTCPWEAIIHDWTIARTSAEMPLLDQLQSAGAGFSYRCVIGAGGEGKSTLLRRVAWHTATTLAGWTVLWTDSHLAQKPASLPLEWTEALADGSKILICADGSRSITGLRAGIEAHWKLQNTSKHVFVLLADRGNEWFRSPTRVELLRARSRPDTQKVPLEPLQPAEQESIARLLSQNGLLYGKSFDVAVQRLRAASAQAGADPGKPYLLPTIMQLTDPADRGFETILESVLSDLCQLPDRASFKLILATSILHGAGLGLPRPLAERLVGSSDALVAALAILQDELERQRWGTTHPLSPSMTGDRYFVHHAVVADGFVTAAYRSSEHREALLTLCGQIPETIRPDLDADLRMPDHLFEVLDCTPRYLDEEMRLYEGAERFLQSWLSLDSRRFPTLHRLAECYSRWFQKELRETTVSKQLARQLLAKARDAYSRSMEVARRVLLPPPAARPSWFTNWRYREHEYKTYHGWAALEDIAAVHLAEPNEARALLLRSILLSLLAFEPHEQQQNARACGTLSLQLIHLGSYDLAAKVTAASIELRNARHIVNRQREMLREKGYEVPDGGAELLDGVLASLCMGPLLQEWQAIGLSAAYRDHVGKLLEVLTRAAEWLPRTSAIDAARLELERPSSGLPPTS